jgi:hypothetical protein
MSKVIAMGVQSDHESGFFEGDDDEVEIIHEEIVNPATFIPRQQVQQQSKGTYSLFLVFFDHLRNFKV